MQTLQIPEPADDARSAQALRAVADETMALPFDGNAENPQHVRQAIAFFVQTPRSEEAFYVRFCALPQALRRALERHWRIDDDWALLRRLCQAYGLRRLA